MTLQEMLDEIKVVKSRMMEIDPLSIEYANLTRVLYMLQHMIIMTFVKAA